MILLRVISLTVLVDSIYNIMIFFAEKMWVSKKFQRICISLNVNFNESLTNDIVSFEQLGPDVLLCGVWSVYTFLPPPPPPETCLSKYLG